MKEASGAKTLQQKIEETMSRVCQMPRKGDLEGLLIQEVEERRSCKRRLCGGAKRFFPPAAVAPANPFSDKPLRLLGRRRRRARTLLGEMIVFERVVWECPATRRQVAPLDGELGLEPGAKMARRLVEKVAWAGARSPFGQASEDLARLAGLEVSRAEVDRVVRQEGERVLLLQEERQKRLSAPVAKGQPVFPAQIRCPRLVVQADSATALTVEGEDHKQIHCAGAFDADACRGADQSGRPFILESRYAASAESMEEFGPAVAAWANRMGARSAQAMAFIADGAPALWKMAAERLPRATLIQDFWHVAQRLHGLARDLGSAETLTAAAASEQAAQWCSLLRQSRVEEIIRLLSQEAQKHFSEVKKARIEQELSYLEYGKHRMDYQRYEREGWPIGSGAIEGTCKYLVKQRLAATGARWRRANLPKIMALRLYQANEEWDQDFDPALFASPRAA
jgi:hypothetical protein